MIEDVTISSENLNLDFVFTFNKKTINFMIRLNKWCEFNAESAQILY